MDEEFREERLQQQMKETRASLTEKLETLEQKVVGTVENATTTVNETVDAIKESVHETVATVQVGVKDGVESIKDALDVPAHVQRHPWAMLGGSIAIGFVLGTMLSPRSQRSSVVTSPFPPAPPQEPAAPQYRTSSANTPATQSSEAPSVWASEVAKIKGLALGVLFGTARELLVSSMPEHVGDQLKEVVDSVTKKVGGEPLPSSDWAALCEPVKEEEPMANMNRANQPDNGHAASRRW